MKMAMAMADKLGGEKKVDYVNTHGTSTPVGDTPWTLPLTSALTLILTPNPTPNPKPEPERGTRTLNPHPDSNPGPHQVGDTMELAGIKTVFTEAGYQPFIGSTKSLSGHALGAAGVHEAIYCMLMMQKGFLAESANINDLVSEPEPESSTVTPALTLTLTLILALALTLTPTPTPTLTLTLTRWTRRRA